MFTDRDIDFYEINCTAAFTLADALNHLLEQHCCYCVHVLRIDENHFILGGQQ